jgi:hypothetical protein
MSKRKSTQNRTEALLGAAFFAATAATYLSPDAGGSIMGLYLGLCGALGYSGGKYHDSEGARPSGTRPAATVNIGP